MRKRRDKSLFQGILLVTGQNKSGDLGSVPIDRAVWLAMCCRKQSTHCNRKPTAAYSVNLTLTLVGLSRLVIWQTYDA